MQQKDIGPIIAAGAPLHVIKRYLFGAAMSFFAMVGLCLVIHPGILHNYQFGVSQFGAIRSTQIPFFVGFAITAVFLGLIAWRLWVASRFLSIVISIAVLCLVAIAITSYPINRFTYDLHWCFVIALIFDIFTAMVWHVKNGSPSVLDYTLDFIFIATTVISILPLIHHIPFFRNFVLRETTIFAASFWFIGRVVVDVCGDRTKG